MRFGLSIIIFFLLSGLTACSEAVAPLTPDAAYQELRQHFRDKNVAAVADRVYVAPEVRTRQSPEEFVERVRGWVASRPARVDAEGELVAFELVAQRIEGDVAQLDYLVPFVDFLDDHKTKIVWTITMRRENGVWKWVPGYSRSF